MPGGGVVVVTDCSQLMTVRSLLKDGQVVSVPSVLLYSHCAWMETHSRAAGLVQPTACRYTIVKNIHEFGFCDTLHCYLWMKGCSSGPLYKAKQVKVPCKYLAAAN